MTHDLHTPTPPPQILIFVNSVESGLRVRLFLEAFGVRAALVHSELPLNSRHHILQEFNRGLFDILVATDDVHAGEKKEAKEGTGRRGRRAQKQPQGPVSGQDVLGGGGLQGLVGALE